MKTRIHRALLAGLFPLLGLAPGCSSRACTADSDCDTYAQTCEKKTAICVHEGLLDHGPGACFCSTGTQRRPVDGGTEDDDDSGAPDGGAPDGGAADGAP